MGKSPSAHTYPKKKLADIIETRLEDMFALVTAHLKKIGKNELLPAGIILTGGGSGIHTLEDFAAAATRLHARVPGTTQITQLAVTPRIGPNDTSWFVAYGLTIMGASQGSNGGLSSSSSRHSFVETIRRAVKQLLP
jgi:cell division protein FtsA